MKKKTDPVWQSCRSDFCSGSADPCRGRKLRGVHQFSECEACRIDRNTERYNVWFELSVTDKPDGWKSSGETDFTRRKWQLLHHYGKRVIAKIETIQSHILMPLCCISMWLFDIKNGRKEYPFMRTWFVFFSSIFYGSELLQIFSEPQFPAPVQACKDLLPSRPCQVAWSSRSEKRSKAFFIHLFFQQIHYLHQCFLTVHFVPGGF